MSDRDRLERLIGIAGMLTFSPGFIVQPFSYDADYKPSLQGSAGARKAEVGPALVRSCTLGQSGLSSITNFY
jgi:hypothetical protein